MSELDVGTSLRIRYLGWAGVEVRSAGAAVAIDAIQSLGIMSRLVSEARTPLLAPSSPTDSALLTHLHRDHADAAAIGEFLAADGVILRPPTQAEGDDRSGTEQTETALAELDRETTVLEPWQAQQIGDLRITALPAVDGFGDPQVGWHISDGRTSIVHGGDTLFHGQWWETTRRLGPPTVAILPVNGPIVTMPNRQPPSDRPAAMTPEDAVAAARILGAETLVPAHYDTMYRDPVYHQTEDIIPRLQSAVAAADQDMRLQVLAPGDEIELPQAT